MIRDWVIGAFTLLATGRKGFELLINRICWESVRKDWNFERLDLQVLVLPKPPIFLSVGGNDVTVCKYGTVADSKMN